MTFPSDEQRDYINEPLCDAILIACPGSGKTTTAVERFISRCRAKANYGIAYLSYTRVAVSEAKRQAEESGALAVVSYPNEILTIDSFFRSFVFDIFAYAAEPDLPRQIAILEDNSSPPSSSNEVKLWGLRKDGRGRTIPLDSWLIQPYVENRVLRFRYETNRNTHDWEILPTSSHKDIVAAKLNLLRSGYTTHGDLLLFSRLLMRSSRLRIPEILAKRFGEIIVDEAQDTSEIQQRMFDQLAKAGVKVSYVGDPGQGIYQFNKANPRFLSDLVRDGKKELSLKETFRSNKPIVDVLNSRFARGIRTERGLGHAQHGAYVVVDEPLGAVATFKSRLTAGNIALNDAAIVGRQWSHVADLVKAHLPDSWRIVPRQSAEAYQYLRRGEASAALDSILPVFRAAVNREAWSTLSEYHQRVLAWRFLRSSCFPVPLEDEMVYGWGERLRTGLSTYLGQNNLPSSKGFGQYARLDNLSEKRRIIDTLRFERIDVRTTVIHQVKGESIKGVLVIAPEQQHNQWLYHVQDGDEEFNVCYVAFSRAADLLMIQCPTEAIADAWIRHGYKRP